MSETITSKLIISDDGTIDQKSCVDVFCKKLQEHIIEREIIAKTVISILNENKTLKVYALIMLTLTKLNAQPENYKSLYDKINRYVHSVNKSKSGSFIIKRGKNGGVFLRDTTL